MNHTELVLVLDRSSSMISTKAAAEEGLQGFVKGQRDVEGEATLAFYRFDDYPENVFVKDLKVVEDAELKLEPRGCTALYDAIGTAIEETEERLKNPTPEKKKRLINLKGKNGKPVQDKVIFVIVTDGKENSSKKWCRSNIFDRITELRKKDWEFTFVGANQDALQEGSKLGISADQSLSYMPNTIGTVGTYNVMSKAIASSRVTGKTLCYSADQRKTAMAEDDIDKITTAK